MSESSEFTAIMGQVAEIVLGEFLGAKNKALSTAREWRWGKNGSISVDLQKGVWSDHESQTGGGVLDLLRAFKGFEKGEAIAWLQENGLIERREQQGQPQNRPSGEKFAGFMDDWPIATFRYLDDRGQLAYEVLKFSKEAPRRYMQRRPHPSGKGWIWGLQEGLYGKVRSGDWFKAKEGKIYDAEQHLDDTRWWLYHRAEVIDAVKAGKPVILVEGEKDVETLRAWGFVATTNQGGAKNWKPQLNEDLVGADIYICSDLDAAGSARTTLRGAELRPIARSVRVIDLAKVWPDHPDKQDVTDWKEKMGGDAQAFSALIDKAPAWTPEPPKSRFNAVTWSHLDDPGPDLEFLVDGWLTEGERSVIGGPSRSGKSFLAIHMAMCVARGVDFFDRAVQRGGVVYQAGEGARGVKRRLRSYARHFNVPENEDVPFVFLGSKVDLYARDGDTQALIDEIKAWSLTMPVPLRLVVIDTLATATAGADENSGKDMGVVLANIARINEETGAHVMLVHHMNADGKKLRGHTSVFANVDQVITVLSDETTRIRTATLAKQKDDEDGLKLTFSLLAVKLGFNERTQRDITSCVVVSVGEKERLKKEQEKQGFSANPTERRILMNLFDAIDRHGKFITDHKEGPRSAVGRTVVQWDHYREVALERMPEIDDQKKAVEQIRKEFTRAKDFLIKAGIIGVDKPWLWWDGKPVRGFPRTFSSGRSPDGRQTEAPPLSPGMEDFMSDSEVLL